VDEKGNVVDGDVIMAILATHLKEQGKLAKNTLVTTVMSNLGLFQFAKKNNINLEATKVGDRYVLEKMLKCGYNLGGEQSGHLILRDFMSTGDGQLTAITLLSILKQSGKTLSELASVMEVYPQVMVNVRADAVMKSQLDVDPGAKKIIEDAKAVLGPEGRILVRASGTEPLIRVMIEGREKDEIAALADQVADQLKERLSQNEDCKKLEGF
jgi:phosphoglucosamine mutase